MKNENNSNRNMETAKTGAQFSKRIGTTTYLVSVHFSGTGRETIEDKIMRLIESEVGKTA